MGIPNYLPYADLVTFILSHPTHPGNVGATARAMKTMGFHHLGLINPKLFPSAEASTRASRATDILEDAKVSSNLTESLQGIQLVAGTSARSRTLSIPVVTPEELADKMAEEMKQGRRCAVLFGTEKYGLSNEELVSCHYHVSIPTNPDYSSLNLASAVQIIAYELSKRLLKETDMDASSDQDLDDEVLASFEELDRLYDHIEETLVEIGFLNPDNPRHLMARLKRLYNRARPSEVEVKILRGILALTQKHHKSAD